MILLLYIVIDGSTNGHSKHSGIREWCHNWARTVRQYSVDIYPLLAHPQSLSTPLYYLRVWEVKRPSIEGFFHPQTRHVVKPKGGFGPCLRVIYSATCWQIHHLHIIIQCLIDVGRDYGWSALARGRWHLYIMVVVGPRVVCACFLAAAEFFCAPRSSVVSVVGEAYECLVG